MDVLVNLAGDHLHTLSWLVGVMCFADPDDREIGWSYFQSVEQYADAAQLTGLLVSFMKEEIDDVRELNTFFGNVTRNPEIRDAQGMICAALAKAGKTPRVTSLIDNCGRIYGIVVSLASEEGLTCSDMQHQQT